MSTYPPQPRGAQPQSWLSRNWKWLVPVGCLGALASIVLFIVGIVLIVFGAIKTSDVYRHALNEATTSPLVIDALGEPIEAGWYLSGSINVSGSSGDADIVIPISGPEGEGRVYAVAAKSAGRWTYEVLEVEIDGMAERIDLTMQ